MTSTGQAPGAAPAGAVPAIRVAQAGGPEVLKMGEVTLGTPEARQVRVEISHAGINFVDIYRRSGIYPSVHPYTPGVEGAGKVVAVGQDVDEVRVGDRVAWTDFPGSYAASVLGPADRLIPLPDFIDDRTASALVLQGITAHYLATDSFAIRPGDTVLIHAGAGGAGLLLTQIAKIKGATVITTVSSAAKGKLSAEAGADHVLVGYHGFAEKVRELTRGAGVHAVYDGVGRDTFDGSLASLARRGTLVLFGGASGQVPPFDIQRLNSGGSLKLTRPTMSDFVVTRAELLDRAADLFKWVADGSLAVTIGGVYPLAEAAGAHRDLAARRTTGKLLLRP